MVTRPAGDGAKDPDGGGGSVASVTGPIMKVRKTPDDGIEDDTEFYETWWFWTIVGGVLVGGGAATYYALQNDGGGTPSGFRTTVSF